MEINPNAREDLIQQSQAMLEKVKVRTKRIVGWGWREGSIQFAHPLGEPGF